MGLHTGTIVVENIFKRTCRWILGQVMDLNCFIWIFNLVLVEQRCFDQLDPPTPPHLLFIAPLARLVNMLMQVGVILQQNKYILGNCGIKNTKGDL
jgi:hypothetical protein